MSPARSAARTVRRMFAASFATSVLVGAGVAAPVATSATSTGAVAWSQARGGGQWVTWRDHGPDGGVARLVAGPGAQSGLATARTTAPCPGAMGTSPDRFLKFTCVVGSASDPWTPADRSAIAAMLSATYRGLVTLVGRPMHAHTVTIVPDATLSNLAFDQAWYQVDANGLVVPGSCRAEIHIHPTDARDAQLRIHYLPHEVLHAFHGCQAPPTPAVEEGMTEAAASIARQSIADALGVAWNRPSEPTGLFVGDSAVPIADQLDGPLMSAARWTNTDGAARPQTALLYSAAATSWWTLWRIDGSFFKTWNTRWRAQDRHTDTQAARLARVHRIAGDIVLSVGTMSYATWKSQQDVMAQRHSAGFRVLCADGSTQRADGFMAGLVQVIATDTQADDRVFTENVRVSMVKPDGSNAFPPTTVAGDQLDAGFLFGQMSGSPIAQQDAGAYRLTVQRASNLVVIGRCWFIGGLRGSNKLIVVAEPGQTVKVTVPKRVNGHIVRVTLTQAVGPDRVAMFAGVKPGIGLVGLDSGNPTKVAAIGVRGAVVALSAP